MANQFIRICSVIALAFLAGCSSEVQVSVDGFGSVTEVNSDFRSAQGRVPNPAKPVIKSVSGVSPTRISILWQAAKRENRSQGHLSYLLYVSADKDRLLDKDNLVSTIAGNMFGEYSFQYDVAQSSDLTLQRRVVHVAVVERDEAGDLGEAAFQYDVRLQQAELEMAYDVLTQKSAAPPPEGDGEI